MFLFIILVVIVVLIDLKSLKQANPKGRIIGIYAVIMSISIVVGILIFMGKRPVSPAEIIEAIVRITGVVK